MSDDSMNGELVHAGQPLLEVSGVSQGMFGASGSGDTSGFGGLVTVVPVPARVISSVWQLLRCNRR